MFGSSRPPKSILVAVKPWTDKCPDDSRHREVDMSKLRTVDFDANTGAVTLQGVRTETNEQGGVIQDNVEALGSTNDESRVQTMRWCSRGIPDLLKIRLDEDGLDFKSISATLRRTRG